MADETFLFVGCLNRRLPAANGKGIAIFSFDPETGRCRPLSVTKGIDNPSYLAFEPGRSCIYATSEVAGWNEGLITAYRLDRTSGRLRYLNKQPTLGSIAAHTSVTPDGCFVLVANYAEKPAEEGPGQAVAAFPIRDDGGLGPACGSVAHHGNGPNKQRQERPHAHCVLAGPDGRSILVADLGIDAVLRHRLRPDGTLAGDSEPFRLSPGSGPRHIAIHPSRAFACVINELNSTISVLSLEEERLRLLETVPTLPPAAIGENHPSGLGFSPDGRFLYGSNRGHDSIAVYSVEAATGRLTLIGHASSGGKTPRSIAVDPSGQWLLAGNQNSDNIAFFRIDPHTGALADTGNRLETGTPMCVKFGVL